MTTQIKVLAHNYPALVQVLDRDHGGQSEKAPDGDYRVVDEIVLTPTSGERIFHCTTTRMIKVTDLELNDERVSGKAPRAGMSDETDPNAKATAAANDGKATGSGEYHKQDKEHAAGHKRRGED